MGKSARWFGQAFAIASLAHIIGSAGLPGIAQQPTALRASWIVLGALSIWLFLSPSSKRALAAVAAMVPVTAWFEAPTLGNHWLLASFVAVAVLLSLTREDPWKWFVPVGRAILLTFYGFAAFAKLNFDFFDPVVSCAVEHGDRALRAYGLPGIDPGGGLAHVAIVLTVLIELSVFVLLLIKRTRPYGVMLGVLFHLVISYDISQHFYDFTSILFALFGLFVVDSLPEQIKTITERSKGLLPGVLVAYLYLAVTATDVGVRGLVHYGAFLIWVPLSVIMARQMLTAARAQRAIGQPVRVAPQGALGVGLIVLVVLNGLAPYAQVKSATAWNMYSNLAVVDGSSNHILVRAPIAIGPGPGELVEIVETSDESLDKYVGWGYLVPTSNLASYLDSTEGVSVTYRTGTGELVTASSTDFDGPNIIRDRMLSFRSVDSGDANRCLLEWGVAR